ncbi:MAG: N-6 DNA methylase [Fusobacteriaceae bacterium]|nr:N-6 DNA methylase [Fusobacteriaceae bacterium]
MIENEKSIKELGQYNTKETIIDFILKQNFFPKDKNISILEPSSGSGNFLKKLKENGYNNIIAYEIDKKYIKTGARIGDYLKLEINKEFDLIIGNPPFTSTKTKKSYYGNGETEFKTRFIEMLFLEKSLRLLKKNGKVIFIFPNRLFLDKKFNRILKIIYDKGFYINRIVELPLNIFTNTESTSSVLIVISRKKTGVYVNGHSVPIKQFLEDSNYILYKDKEKYIDKHGVSLGDLMEKIPSPKEEKDKIKVTAGNLSIIKDKHPNYLAIVRNGNSSVGRFSLFNPDKYYFNECFYFYKIKNGYAKKIIPLLKSKFYKDYIQLISKRTGSKSISSPELLKLRVK